MKARVDLNAAHQRGLSICLKNDVGQVVDPEPYFDWALNEECYNYEVKISFGAVLRQVNHTGGPSVVERAGRPVAVILSVRAYAETCRAPLLPTADRIAPARAAFGMWAGGREDIGDDWLVHSC